MEKLEFTKKDTAIIKGVAIICMFMHHLFAFPERIKAGSNYISLFSVSGINMEIFLGAFGQICVSLFLFLSGFGIYKKNYNNRENVRSIIVKQLKTLYINYWIIFAIFIPISFFIGTRVFGVTELFYNLIGYYSTYNGEWWFFQLYVLTMITYPITIKVVRNSPIISIVNITLINVITQLILLLVKNEILIGLPQSFFYKPISLLLVWLPCFLMGCTFAKFNLFYKIEKWIKEKRIDNILIYLLICMAIFYIRCKNEDKMNLDYLFAPIFIIASNNIVKSLSLDKFFAFFGKHSTNMWLMHSFFCYQYFQKLVYYPRIPIIILIWLIILCITCSSIIMYIRKEYNNFINKLSYKAELDNINEVEINNL